MSSAPCPGASPDTWPPAVARLPVCPKRKLPIPYIAEIGADGVGHFTILDDDRARECLQGRLCAMCGHPMGDEVALIGDVASLDPGGYFIEPPVHEHCAVAALGGLCPFISRERVPFRLPDEGVSFVGIERDVLASVGRTIAKRPNVVLITRTYAPALAENDSDGLTMVYLAGPVERVRRYGWVNGLATEIPPAPPVRAVRAQPRRRRPRSRR
jgi:hypothetical protein